MSDTVQALEGVQSWKRDNEETQHVKLPLCKTPGAYLHHVIHILTLHKFNRHDCFFFKTKRKITVKYVGANSISCT